MIYMVYILSAPQSTCYMENFSLLLIFLMADVMKWKEALLKLAVVMMTGLLFPLHILPFSYDSVVLECSMF